MIKPSPELLTNLAGLILALVLTALVVIGLSCADYTPLFPLLKEFGFRTGLC